ncbi:hypothetical protein BT93_G0643 [Corymbia citriodora subsp. variegata]|nr:hypothetical protein BT93_G0643 [Corymbia citriodora subsp. variegata]
MAKLQVRAAVIGAGMSGLVAARELRREGHQVVVFERSDDIGGTWLSSGRDVVHASMYQSLRTNQPRQLMGFLDYPFLKKGSGDPRNFPGHEELIRFRHEVVRVEQAVEGRRDLWAVGWQTCGGEEAAGMDVFEAVVVCNGKHTQPKIAEFPGTIV